MVFEYEGEKVAEALTDAAKINTIYRRTRDPVVGLELHTALYELLEAMIGIQPEYWAAKDLDNIEMGAKAICQVFGVGMTMNRNEPLLWDLDL